jgi:hypothetical protein
MRRVGRYIFNALAVLSLLLCSSCVGPPKLDFVKSITITQPISF